MVLATLCTPIYFEIQEEAFCLIAHNECSKLINIGRQHKCQIEIEENITNHICKIPKATTQDHISNKLTAAAIKIHIDDLAEQKVTILRFEWDLYNYLLI
jgi:diketogulonate reductase-like aldo/keto reductase